MQCFNWDRKNPYYPLYALISLQHLWAKHCNYQMPKPKVAENQPQWVSAPARTPPPLTPHQVHVSGATGSMAKPEVIFITCCWYLFTFSNGVGQITHQHYGHFMEMAALARLMFSGIKYLQNFASKQSGFRGG